MTRDGFPHSEITGSKRVCRSPMLIAAYHVLHRLLMPRHPLCALTSLTKSNFGQLIDFSILLRSLPYANVKEPFRQPGSMPYGLRIKRFMESRPLRGVPATVLLWQEVTCSGPWWAYLDLNQGPHPYQGCALTN